MVGVPVCAIAHKGTPNPALHLTPPARLRRSAHPMMAVQVSLLFGTRRASGCGSVASGATPRWWPTSPASCRSPGTA
ncbi:hypothetical protein C1280_11830 [Gemmata obscuriglobus]|uniref:Uncharacterized protein n=1 Tax=Gemmata obscuriglobus TaxID=114 RepID=A0A2Z3GT96_9BACT|nr:hypothetical protein C1280_11830 [Gemmata obscuriglobus]